MLDERVCCCCLLTLTKVVDNGINEPISLGSRVVSTPFTIDGELERGPRMKQVVDALTEGDLVWVWLRHYRFWYIYLSLCCLWRVVYES